MTEKANIIIKDNIIMNEQPTIFKFPFGQDTEMFIPYMHVRPLKVAVQHPNSLPTIWAEVAGKIVRKELGHTFRLYPTGSMAERGEIHVGSAIDYGTRLVWHVYEI